MRVLLATDGWPCSETAIAEVWERPWPPDSEVKVLTVIHAPAPFFDPFFLEFAIREEMLEEQRKRAPQQAEQAAERIRRQVSGLKVTTEVLEGRPKEVIEVIVEEADGVSDAGKMS